MAEIDKSESVNPTEVAQRFVQLIMVQMQNILYVLGKIPSPDGTLMPPNLQAGKMLIDQLDVIRLKTKGNLSAQESRILEDALQNAKLAFVEASGGTPASMIPSREPNFDMNELEEELGRELGKEPTPTPKPESKPAEPPAQTPSNTQAPEKPDDTKKKFFKSYG